MKKRHPVVLLLLFVIFALSASTVFSQDQPKNQEPEEPFAAPLIGVSFAWVFPGGHMAETYTSFLSAGISGMYKTSQNWIWGLDGNFLFGSGNVKSDKLRDEILKDIMNQQGFITGTGGLDAEVSAYNRGFSITAKAGKLIPFSKKNPNSGLFFTIGGGFLQNQTIFNIGVKETGTVPLLEGDYARGYDGQMRGFQLSEFIGYMFMGNNSQFFNFYVGFEITQAWMKYTRDYIFYLKGPDNNTYFEGMYAIKGVWMFPLKSRKATEFYYY